MKNMNFEYVLLLVLTLMLFSCSDDDANFKDSTPSFISPISDPILSTTSDDKEMTLKWTNPTDKRLIKVEISYTPLDLSTRSTPPVLILDAESGKDQSTILSFPTYNYYIISVVAINKAGVRSKTVSLTTTVGTAEQRETTPLFLRRSDTLMTDVVRLFLEKQPRDIWTSSYPRGGSYWDGAAVIWGHGGAFSGYAALREAAKGYPEYESKYEKLYEDRLLNGIDQFRNKLNNVEAYAVYPGDGDMRYYDDNVWVGLDMIDLYQLTKDQRYMERALLVWNFLQHGMDDVMGGGIYWVEGGQSKHTCSTAPTAVLALKLYKVTNDEEYLNKGKALYTWCKNILQDPTDYLYGDLATLNNDGTIGVDNSKYSYNSGQPMQAAALLYEITKEQQYLIDAQNIAKSAYNRWFYPNYFSHILNKTFYMLDDGHVWFQAIMFRGFVELYKNDGDRTYIDAFENSMHHAWLSSCRNKVLGLMNYDFRGGTNQNSWEVLHEGACIEMLARLASLERDGL